MAFGSIEVMKITRYVKIKEDLWNELLKGQNNDPKTITDAHQIQPSYWRHRNKIRNNNSEGGFPFFNKKDVTCYKCVNKGHISPIFPKEQKNENSNNNSEK